MVEDWGTARERQRRRRRWKWVAVAIALVAVTPLATSFGLGLVEGLTSAHDPAGTVATRDHVAYLGVAAMILSVIAVQAWQWRAADEFERARINSALALAGVAALASLPVLSLAQKPLALPNPAMIGWALAIAALVVTRIVQRLRG